MSPIGSGTSIWKSSRPDDDLKRAAWSRFVSKRLLRKGYPANHPAFPPHAWKAEAFRSRKMIPQRNLRNCTRLPEQEGTPVGSRGLLPGGLLLREGPELIPDICSSSVPLTQIALAAEHLQILMTNGQQIISKWFKKRALRKRWLCLLAVPWKKSVQTRGTVFEE